MTYEEAKKELNSYKYNLILFDNKLDEISRMQELGEKITTVFSHGGRNTSMHGDKVGDAGTTVAQLKNELIKTTNDLANSFEIINRKIQSMEQPYRTILDKIYIQDKTLVEVSAKIGYSYKQSKRKLKEAINLYKDVP